MSNVAQSWCAAGRAYRSGPARPIEVESMVQRISGGPVMLVLATGDDGSQLTAWARCAWLEGQRFETAKVELADLIRVEPNFFPASDAVTPSEKLEVSSYPLVSERLGRGPTSVILAESAAAVGSFRLP